MFFETVTFSVLREEDQKSIKDNLKQKNEKSEFWGEYFTEMILNLFERLRIEINLLP